MDAGVYGCRGVEGAGVYGCWGVGAGVLVLARMLLGCNSAGVWVLECMYVLMGAGVLVCMGAGVWCWSVCVLGCKGADVYGCRCVWVLGCTVRVLWVYGCWGVWVLVCVGAGFMGAGVYGCV